LLGNKAGVNVPFATAYRDDLTEMLNWRVTQNPSACDYLESVSGKRFAPGQTITVYIDPSSKTGFAPDLSALAFKAMNLWCTFGGSPICMRLCSTRYGANIFERSRKATIRKIYQ